MDIGGVPHALGSVTAVFNGVPNDFLAFRRFRRSAAFLSRRRAQPEDGTSGYDSCAGLNNFARLRSQGVNGGEILKAAARFRCCGLAKKMFALL